MKLSRPRTVAALLVATLAASWALAACSTNGSASPTSSSSASSTRADAADVQFAQMMIVHHQGALEMAALAASRAERQEVKDLASRIEDAQQPEIDTMTGWLRSWGHKPLADGGAMPGMHHGDMSMGGEGGMASGTDMTRLQDATGAEFDRLFLQLMIVHHEGAVAMAQTELENGANPEAITLAKKIITDQSAQIEEMKSLLAGTPGS